MTTQLYVVAGGLVIGLATLVGVWLARRHADRRELCFGAAAGALLAIAGAHLLPDAWQAARDAAVPVWAVPLSAVATYAVAGVAVRRGCACQDDRHAAGGAGAAAALTAHRLLEGAALALAGSVTVAVALTVHALAEGLAAGALLASASRRRRAVWVTAMCAGPTAGAAIAAVAPFPPSAQPVILAVAAGVLGQAARVSLTAAFHRARPARLALASPTFATVAAALVTVLAVHASG